MGKGGVSTPFICVFVYTCVRACVVHLCVLGIMCVHVCVHMCIYVYMCNLYTKVEIKQLA